MERVRITKIFDFEMGHALTGHDGKCAHIHGHSYRLEVTLIGFPEKNPESPKLGMVMDFTDLKRVVQSEIIDPLDHALVLNERDPRAQNFSKEENVILLPYQPTCENLLMDMVSKLQTALLDLGTLSSVVLHETGTGRAAWFATDNK